MPALQGNSYDACSIATTASRSSRRIARTSVAGRVTATMVSARDEGASKRAQAIPQASLGGRVGKDRRGWIDQHDLRGAQDGGRQVPAKGTSLRLAEHEIGPRDRNLAEATLSDLQARRTAGDRTESTQGLSQQVEFAGAAPGREDHDATDMLARARV